MICNDFKNPIIKNKNDKDSAKIAADLLKQGKICILPTDTVYGFSGIVDLKNQISYKTDDLIRKIKGRAENKALIQLIAKPSDLQLYTNDKIPQEILEKWPGPLTIIVNVKENSPLAQNFGTVAFRCPGDEWLRNIIEECKSPLFSTSVNRSGKEVLSEISKIKDEFSNEVSLIVDDGDKKNALPSTIIRLEQDEFGKSFVRILRHGAVKIENS